MIIYGAIGNHTGRTVLFYLGGVEVDSLPCKVLGSATKRVKESDLVVTQRGNLLCGKFSF